MRSSLSSSLSSDLSPSLLLLRTLFTILLRPLLALLLNSRSSINDLLKLDLLPLSLARALLSSSDTITTLLSPNRLGLRPLATAATATLLLSRRLTFSTLILLRSLLATLARSSLGFGWSLRDLTFLVVGIGLGKFLTFLLRGGLSLCWGGIRVLRSGRSSSGTTGGGGVDAQLLAQIAVKGISGLVAG